MRMDKVLCDLPTVLVFATFLIVLSVGKLFIYPKFPRRTVWAGIVALSFSMALATSIVVGLNPNSLVTWVLIIPIGLICFVMTLILTYVVPMSRGMTWEEYMARAPRKSNRARPPRLD
jgi:hypothetical protein